MTIEMTPSASIAIVACLVSTLVDLWVGLRATGSSWRDVAQVAKRDRQEPVGVRSVRSPEPGILGCLVGVVGLDLLSCATMVAAVILLQPGARFVANERSIQVLWFIVGLGAPFVSSRVLVGRQVAKVFGSLFAKPSPDHERWLDQPWRVRYRLRRDLMNRVFPLVDKRYRDFDAMLRRLDIPIMSGVLLPSDLRESIIRFGESSDDALPERISDHVPADDVWATMTEEGRKHWAAVAVNLVIDGNLRSVLVGYLIPPDA